MAVYMLAFSKCCILLLVTVRISSVELNPFDDSQRYDILWQNKEDDKSVNLEEDLSTHTTLSMSGRQYRCKPGSPLYRDYEDIQNRPDRPSILLRSLSNLCAIHVDVYWEYEFCYNRHVRQYHVSKDSSPGETSEYILGKYQSSSSSKKEIPDESTRTLFFNGVRFPYHEEVMSEGTLCDLTGRPRKTKVRFICARHVALEFVQFSELTTCEYLIIVATQYLCENLSFRPDEYPVVPLECYPVSGGDGDGAQNPPDEHLAFSDEVRRLKTSFKSAPTSGGKTPHSEVKAHKAKATGVDERFIQSFFQGDQCLVGGKGWWKHEVCYGRSIKQVHVDATGRTEVLLGTWNSQAHNLWFNKNKEKLVKFRHKFVTHYYAKGDFCEESQKHRAVELRFKCIPHDSITMHLQEPTVCKYILTIESSQFCSKLQTALENGLFEQ